MVLLLVMDSRKNKASLDTLSRSTISEKERTMQILHRALVYFKLAAQYNSKGKQIPMSFQVFKQLVQVWADGVLSHLLSSSNEGPTSL